MRTSYGVQPLCQQARARDAPLTSPEDSMNKDIAAGNFKQIKGKIKQQWGKLTDDEIDQLEGNTEILAGKLQERYGWEKEEAERQVKDFSTRHGWNTRPRDT
jgi:uncharacterized protein YjbJ (UPF0337 family)